MHLSPIRTEADYEKILERIDVLMEQEPEIGSREGDELEILALLVEKYEEQHWQIATPDSKVSV
ncbi:MAG: hypothetical protein PHI47_05110 [Sulfuricurvum sp.]|uniref:hypothetical protein n=1 Tax=Sulfuricurvum sp. TaxID=2025608 RepID=UPI002619D5A8|nr:hypothetical protein [Sulfuricurvum sp.]MDD5159407.1 hypothetical protein [Sulfuricurvum sp.]